MTAFSDLFATDTTANYNRFLNSGSLVWNSTDQALATTNAAVNIRAYNDVWTVDEDIDFEFTFKTSSTLTGRIEVLFKLKGTQDFLVALFDLNASGTGTLRLSEKVANVDTALTIDGGGTTVTTSNLAATTTYHVRAQAVGNVITVGWYDDSAGARGALKQQAVYTLSGGLASRWGAAVKGDVGFGWQPGSTSWRLDSLTLTTTARAGNPVPYAGSGPFSSTVFPGASAVPGAASSELRKTVPASPVLHSRSSQLITNLLATTSPQGPGNIVVNTDTVDDTDIPIYFATSSDPLWTIAADNAPFGTFAYNGTQVRIPAGAKPAAGVDKHLSVVQPDGTVWDFYKVTNTSFPAGGGTIHIRWGGVRTDYFGHTSVRTDYEGAIAPNWLAYPGQIRASELQAGLINHAIVCTIRCNGSEFVAPAQKNGLMCSDISESNTDKLGMGHRIHLNYTEAEIDALSIPTYRKVIAKALAKHGAMPGDTNASSWFLRKECGTMYTAFGYDDPLLAFASARFAAGDAGISINASGQYVLDIRSGIDWTRLRVVDMAASVPSDLDAGYAAWHAAVSDGAEAGGQREVVYSVAGGSRSGSIALGAGASTINLATRIAGGYFVTADPRLIQSLDQMPGFTRV